MIMKTMHVSTIATLVAIVHALFSLSFVNKSIVNKSVTSVHPQSQ